MPISATQAGSWGSSSKKKVVIVKKTKGKDGKIVVKRIEKEGEEATKYLKEMKIEGEDGKVIDIDIDVDELHNLGNDIEVIEIEDLDNISEEIKKKLEGLDIELEMLDSKLELLDGKLEGLSEDFEIIELEGDNHFEMMDLGNQDNHLMITPKEGEKSKVETIDISIEDDEYSVEIVENGQTKKYKWKGNIPENIKKEIEALGFEVKQGKASNISKWVEDNKKKLIFDDFYNEKVVHKHREKLYAQIAEELKLKESSFNYLEFGVAGGDSLTWWSKNNTNTNTNIFAR